MCQADKLSFSDLPEELFLSGTIFKQIFHFNEQSDSLMIRWIEELLFYNLFHLTDRRVRVCVCVCVCVCVFVCVCKCMFWTNSVIALVHLFCLFQRKHFVCLFCFRISCATAGLTMAFITFYRLQPTRSSPMAMPVARPAYRRSSTSDHMQSPGRSALLIEAGWLFNV